MAAVIPIFLTVEQDTRIVVPLYQHAHQKYVLATEPNEAYPKQYITAPKYTERKGS